MPAQKEPNPVLQIIATRGAQIGLVDAALLWAAYASIPPSVFWRFVVPANAMLATGGLCAYFASVFVPGALPQPIRWLGVPPRFFRLPSGEPGNIALTFDDGPHPETTPRLLEILGEHNAKATFFLVGERAAKYPQLVAQIAREGHTLGVHGLRHRTMVLQSPAAVLNDLRAAQMILEAATGTPLPSLLVRPPYGFKTVGLCRALHRAGWMLVDWSLDVRDYDAELPDAIIARFERGLQLSTQKNRGGDIVLLHEQVPAENGTPRSQTTLAALPSILQICKNKKISFVALNPSRRRVANDASPFTVGG